MKSIKLFSPGPTPISEESLKALSLQPIHHRSADFKDIIKSCIAKLSLLFDEKHRLILTSTGSGALEACVVNLVSKNDHCLYLDGGKFGERWGEILNAYGVANAAYKFDWGKSPNALELKKLIKKTKPKALFCQACETSTGTAYDLKEISQLLQTESPETLFVVDGITAVGAYPVSMRELKIDALIAGSQKALGLPAGLALVGLSDRAKKTCETSNLPKYYLSFLNELKSLEKQNTFFSSAVYLWRALLCELEKIEAQGLEEKFKLNKKLQTQVLSFAKEESIPLFSSAPSPSLTALDFTGIHSAQEIQKKMYEKGYFVAAGQAEYKDRILRIGHMANLTEDDMEQALKALKEVLS